MSISNIASIKKVEDVTKDKNIFKVIKGSIISIIITLIVLTIYAAVLSYTTVSESTMVPVVITITGISILIGSSIGNFKASRNGLLNGAIIGGIYLLSLYVLSGLIYQNFGLTMTSIIVIISGMICGMFGGIIGVNKV